MRDIRSSSLQAKEKNETWMPCGYGVRRVCGGSPHHVGEGENDARNDPRDDAGLASRSDSSKEPAGTHEHSIAKRRGPAKKNTKHRKHAREGKGTG